MQQALRHVWGNPWARLAIGAAGAVLVWVLVRQTLPIWLSLGIAYTVAYLTQPIPRFFDERGLPKWLGGIVTVLGLILLLGIVSVILRQVISQMILLVEQLPQVLQTLEQMPDRLQRILPPQLQEVFGETIGLLRDPVQDLSDNVATWLEERGGVLLGEIPSVVLRIFRSVVIPIMTLYLIFDFDRVNASIRRAVPPRWRDGFDGFTDRLDRAAGAYIKAQLFLATLVGLMVWAGLALFGMPMALALGFLAGVGNLIPFFGPILAGVPAILIAFGQGAGYALLIAVFLFAVQQIDGNVLSPIVFSQTTRLHPLTVLLAILLGSAFFGLLGAILAVPVAALLVQIYREDYLTSDWYREGSEDARG